MNRITPEQAKHLYQTWSITPKQGVFFAKHSADILGMLYAEKYGLRETVRTDKRLASGEITYRNVAEDLDLHPEYVEGILAGWDGCLLNAGTAGTNAEQTEAGFEDGTSCWSAVNGW